MNVNILNNWIKRCRRKNKSLEQLVKVRTAELEHEIKRLQQIEVELRKRILQKCAIFDAEPDAIIFCDECGRIVMANKQVEILLGYKPTELVDQSIEVLVPLRMREQHRQYREAYCAELDPRLLKMRLSSVLALRKDGTEIDVEINLSPIQTEDGLLFAASLRDITDRKLFETALKASEERFRLMANNSPIMIWITDKDGLPTFSNQSRLDFVGLNSSTSMSHTEWRELVHPDDVNTIFAAYYDSLHTHSPISAEYRLRHASGEWRWVFDQGVPMFNDSNVFIGYIGSVIDITARKYAEAELRISAIAFESNDAMMITDSTGVILRVNSAFTTLTGYSPAEVIGNKKMNLFHTGYGLRHQDEVFYKSVWRTLIHDGSWQGEVWDRRKNGEIYLKLLSITAVTNTNNYGELTYYVGTQVDITERKEEENKIRDLAYYDSLTQLPNRRLLQERMEHCIAISQREHKRFAVLMLDLDKFKAVNDNLGHLAGDELLQQVSARLSAILRESDTIARLGGDEFIVLLGNITNPDDTALIAESIVMELSKPFKLTQSNDVKIGGSVGISIYPFHGSNPTQLIANADLALYQAKAKGRGCFAYFSKQ